MVAAFQARWSSTLSGLSEGDNSPGLENSDAAWEELSRRIDALAIAWSEGGEPPPLGEFLPTGPPLRRMVLIELVKVDLEHRWRSAGHRKLLEDYCRQFPELEAGEGLPADLIYEEYHVRRQAGEQVDLRDYRERFPLQGTNLEQLLQTESPQLTTALVSQGPPAKIDVGETVDDFELLARLGKGAFATVYLARQRSMQRLVALKISSDRGEEPQTLAQLDHDHIVRVFDQRRLAGSDLRLLYMQYVAGGTLHSVIRHAAKVPPGDRSGRTLLAAVDEGLGERGEFPPGMSPLRDKLAGMSWPQAVCWIGARLADALDYAHRRGVLHRDIKPANVLVTAEGSPKLVDFNISYSNQVQGATPAAYFGGSLAYMSPEQMDAAHPSHDQQPEDLDGRSDVYSLGVLLWELLTTQRPFADEVNDSGWTATLESMRRRRAEGVAPRLVTQLPADCPPGLDRVLLRCMAAEPSERYPSGSALAQELELCLYPEVRRLVQPPERGWRKWAQRWPVLAFFLVAITPNVAAAKFNLEYNVAEIIRHVSPAHQRVFWQTVVVMNLTAFTAGMGLFAWLIWPVAAAQLRLRRGEHYAADRLSRVRRRCLLMSHYAALIAVADWMIAGVAYPVSLSLLVEPIPLEYTVHFIVSLLLCGLIASAYPFFGLAVLCVRAFYPPLVRWDWDAAEEMPALERLSRLAGVYLVLAAMLPMVSLAVVIWGNVNNRLAVGTLIGIGLLGFVGVLWLYRALQRDLGTLALALRVTSGGAVPGSGASRLESSNWLGKSA